jgi:hypothetical protein
VKWAAWLLFDLLLAYLMIYFAVLLVRALLA